MDNEPSGREYPSGLEVLGTWMSWVGLLLILYFVFIFDTTASRSDSVQISQSAVNTVVLVADRQDGIIIGFGCAILGAIYYAIGITRPSLKKRSGISILLTAATLLIAVAYITGLIVHINAILNSFGP